MSDQQRRPKPPQQTLDQRRAQHAMKAVEQVKAVQKQDAAKKFGGQARKLPVRIAASGLGQALAFLKAKGYAPDLLNSLGDWVLGVVKPAQDVKSRIDGKPTDERLLTAVVFGTADFLRQATDEVLAYLQWLNRFCEATGLTDDVEVVSG